MTNISPLLPQGVNLKDLLESLRYLSWGAADILLAYAKGQQPPYGFSKDLVVEDLEDGPVSKADLAVNSWILKGLKAGFPKAQWKLLSEENAKQEINPMKVDKNQFIWIVDPLDGTKDFLYGNGEYAVHIALVQGHKSILGAVLIPELEELWFGIIGIGSWCEKRNRKRFEPSFSNRRECKDLILVSSRNHRDQRMNELVEALQLSKTKTLGSVGCKVASILRGDCDFYISLSGKTWPKDWDMAAPEVILTAAGGRFTHLDGMPLMYNQTDRAQKGCLLASHGYSHARICNKTFNAISTIDPSFIC